MSENQPEPNDEDSIGNILSCMLQRETIPQELKTLFKAFVIINTMCEKDESLQTFVEVVNNLNFQLNRMFMLMKFDGTSILKDIQTIYEKQMLRLVKEYKTMQDKETVKNAGTNKGRPPTK